MSRTVSFQSPEAGLPSNAESGSSGVKLPVKGAVPAEIGVTAELLNTVFTKLSPLEPRRLNKRTVVPSGDVRSIVKSPDEGMRQ